MQVVHIIPADRSAEVILESVKASGHPIHRAYVVYEKDESKKVAEEVKNVLSSLVDVETREIAEKGVYPAVWEILRIARKEKDAGNEVLINVSDASRRMSLAGMIAAQISGSKIYIFSDGGVSEILKPPIRVVNEDKLEILRVLDREGGQVESINRLIELVEGKIEEHKKYMAQRARMSYHLNGLEEDGLVVTERRGKNLRITLTELGKAYVIMFG